MGTKVVKVTFPDGAKMYGTFSTVSGQIESDLVSLPPQGESFIDNPETIPDEDVSGDDIVEAALQAASKPYPVVESAKDEIVQCEVLLYGDCAWVSKAKRHLNVGAITGVMHGEEYIGDWQEAAEQMDREKSKPSGLPTQRQSWLKRLLG